MHRHGCNSIGQGDSSLERVPEPPAAVNPGARHRFRALTSQLYIQLHPQRERCIVGTAEITPPALQNVALRTYRTLVKRKITVLVFSPYRYS